MANYGAPPTSFGAPPGFSSYMAAPGLGPAPSTAGAPGITAPPGLSAESPVNGSAPFNPANFQLPPGINPHASVIRLGPQTSRPGLGSERREQGPGNRGRSGLGMDHGRYQRDNNVQPLTKEEVTRTIYIGNLVHGMPGDDMIEDILATSNGLRRWTRVTDVDGKPLDFGFAEFDDAASMQICIDILENTDIPLMANGKALKDEEDNDLTTKFTVIVDPQTRAYLDQWLEGTSDLEFRTAKCLEDLQSALAGYKAGSLRNGDTDGLNGDTKIPDYAGQAAEQAELLAIPAADDDLSDIPADQREMVAVEIAAFRERSNKRDLERLKMEEDLEKAERIKSETGRYSRLATPPPTAPKGPGGVNGAPSGPRAAAAKGPKRGLQIPKDHTEPFVTTSIKVEDGESGGESDSEIENKKQERHEQTLQKIYLEQERKWLQKEKVHFAAVERQKLDDARETDKRSQRKDALAEKLNTFDDEQGDGQKHLFHQNRRAWRAERRHIAYDERRADDRERRSRRQAAYDKGERRDRREDRRGEKREDRGSSYGRDYEHYDDTYTRRARESEQENPGFSLKFGEGGFVARPARDVEDDSREKQAARSMLADMENLLDDDGNAADGDDQDEQKAKDTLEFKPLAAGEKLTEVQRAKASGELAKSIPGDAERLFPWKIKWSALPPNIISEQLRPYVQRKIMEALGVQEDLLVARIEKILLDHGTAEEVMKELEETLDDEAEMVTCKVWKMVVFYSESGARGLLVT